MTDPGALVEHCLRNEDEMDEIFSGYNVSLGGINVLAVEDKCT